VDEDLEDEISSGFAASVLLQAVAVDEDLEDEISSGFAASARLRPRVV